MCNIALMLGSEIQWDADKREFTGDDQAKALMTRPRRKGFSMVETSQLFLIATGLGTCECMNGV